MNVTCVRAGTGYVVLNAQHDIVGIIKSFEDSWKIETPKSFKKAFTDVRGGEENKQS